jgi:thymidylate kinase
MSRRRPTTFVSFSGVDGSGKSTQIKNLFDRLNEAGIHVRVLAFWDDIAVLGGLREFSSHKLFNSEAGIGAPDRPVNRRDKNVRHWFMTPLRFFLYFLDALYLRIVVAKLRKTDADVVIFDRYIYDELANLNLAKPVTRTYARLLLRLAPRPDVANLLDADPIQARNRKPEYPLEFIYSNRASYLKLAELSGVMNVISAGPVAEVHRQIMARVSKKLSSRQAEAMQQSLMSSDFLPAEQRTTGS